MGGMGPGSPQGRWWMDSPIEGFVCKTINNLEGDNREPNAPNVVAAQVHLAGHAAFLGFNGGEC